MLQKLRLAMIRLGRERLSGFVEVDETYIGGEEEGVDCQGDNLGVHQRDGDPVVVKQS